MSLIRHSIKGHTKPKGDSKPSVKVVELETKRMVREAVKPPKGERQLVERSQKEVLESLIRHANSMLKDLSDATGRPIGTLRYHNLSFVMSSRKKRPCSCCRGIGEEGSQWVTEVVRERTTYTRYTCIPCFKTNFMQYYNQLYFEL